MKTSITSHAFSIFFALLLIFCTMTSSYGAESKTLAILPFTMNSAQDLGFLREGIMDMLSSRLVWKDKLDVLEKGVVKKAVAAVPGPMDEAKALQIGGVLGAQYVIFGSLTTFGESISLDAKILDIGKKEVVMTAYDQSKGKDGIIPTVNRFAENISAKIMGRDLPAREEGAGESARRGRHAGALVRGGEDTDASHKKPSLVRRFKFEIRGLDVGDLDGDGNNDLVLMDKTNLFVFKWQKRGPFLFKTIEGGWSSDYIFMNVADIDGNGKAEIYVCNLSATNAGSRIFEWDGSGFKAIVHDQPWLIRVVDLPGRGKVVLGQQRSAEGNFVGDVHLLKRQGDDLVSAGVLTLPRFSNVFNFAQWDLSANGSSFTVLLDPWEHLNVCDPSGQQLWKSDDFFGGSLVDMQYMDPDANRMADTAKRLFVSSPILTCDVNGDGKREVVICQNDSESARIFDGFRYFASGRVHFMDWDEASLVSRWTSQKLSGTIVAYRVADVDNDGMKELAVGSVTSGSIAGSPKARLVVYELE